MLDTKKTIPVILIGISIVGALGIPMGDPRFFVNALGLEFVFVSLAILSIRRLKFSLIPNMIISCVVIIGNTISPQHVDIMISLNPIENAVVLIIGGYILQALLFVTSFIQLKNRKKLVNIKKGEGFE